MHNARGKIFCPSREPPIYHNCYHLNCNCHQCYDQLNNLDNDDKSIDKDDRVNDNGNHHINVNGDDRIIDISFLIFLSHTLFRCVLSS